MEIFKRYRDYLQTLTDRSGLFEVNGIHRSKSSITYSDGRRVAASAAEESCLYARAGERSLGSMVSQCLNDTPEALLNQAMTMCADSSAPLSVNFQRNLQSYEVPRQTGSVEEQEQLLREMDKKLPFNEKVLELQEITDTCWICNQKGLSRQYSRRRLELDVDYLGLHWNLSAEDTFDLKYLIADMQDCLENQLPLGNCSSGKYAAVLSNFAFCKFWVMGWKLFCGQLENSALKDRMNTQIASEQLCLRDVAEHEDTGYAFPFDCEGSTAVDVTLIDRGRLSGSLTNLSLGYSTGNAGRTAGLVKNYDIGITPKNFLFDCGRFSTEELLQRLQDGLYIFDVFDEFHGINVASGQFSFPCRAVRIVDGKKTELLEGLTINGNILDLLKSVHSVGDHRCYMPLLMHKCWQVGAPAVLISDISITGNI